MIQKTWTLDETLALHRIQHQKDTAELIVGVVLLVISKRYSETRFESLGGTSKRVIHPQKFRSTYNSFYFTRVYFVTMDKWKECLYYETVYNLSLYNPQRIGGLLKRLCIIAYSYCSHNKNISL